MNKKVLLKLLLIVVALGAAALVTIHFTSSNSKKEDVKEAKEVKENKDTKETKNQDKKVEPEKETILLDKNEIHIVEKETYQLTATISSKNSNTTWKSNNENVATVDQYGKIEAKSVGKAEITVTTSKGTTTKCLVYVEKQVIPIKELKFAKKELTMTIDESIKIEIEITPKNATENDLIWESSNPTIATMKDGLVTAIKDGTTTITVKTKDNITATCKITVNKKTVDVTEISLDKENEELFVNDTVTLKPTINPENATVKNVTWTSSNIAVATVKDGLVTAKNPGTATITAKTNNGKTATCKITVKEKLIEATSISLNKQDETISIDQTITLKAIINPENVTNRAITWTSSDETVATVKDGLVTALKIGTTTITAKTNNGKTATCNITVGNNKNYAEVYFLNIYNKPSILSTLTNDATYKNGYGLGLSAIIKTIDDKYILIDTGMKNSAVKNVIYDQLSEIQDNSQVTIDYMIITHSHGDHSGNAVSILKDANINTKNVIMKKESKNLKPYTNVVNSLGDSSNIVYLTSEGQKITVGNYLELYLFNVDDVYKDKTCHDVGERYSFYASTTNAIQINGKYYYFDGSKYPNIQLIGTDTIITKSDTVNKSLDNYYYLAKADSNKNDCNANANSLGIIIKVKTSNGNRYMYFSGDIDNSGYDITEINGIYGNGAQIVYPIGGEVGIAQSYENGILTGYLPELNRLTSETTTASNISKYFGNEINNITIYQVSHHGLNNAPDAINILGLNRSNVHAVVPSKSSIGNSTIFINARTYYYTLSNANKYFPGGKTKNGVYCNINDVGKTSCNNY